MKDHNLDALSSLPLLKLFQAEVESQAEIISNGLLELERNPEAIHGLEALLRATHSVKGAARIVNRKLEGNLAHVIEDCLVAAQQRRSHLAREAVDTLFWGLDLLLHAAQLSELDLLRWERDHSADLHGFLCATAAIISSGPPAPEQPGLDESEPDGGVIYPDKGKYQASPGEVTAEQKGLATTGPSPVQSFSARSEKERALRMTSESLNRLLGLTGESLAESRWFHPFANSLLNLKRMQSELLQTLDRLRDSLAGGVPPEKAGEQTFSAIEQARECRRFLGDRLVELDMFDRRSASLSHRLYREVLQCRMRPFGDGLRRIPRMVRDLSRLLHKEIRLEIAGEHTLVDSEILEKLEIPLVHLLRNAADHGCESPGERKLAGKNPECTIRLEARHNAGVLQISVADDGRGVPLDLLRETAAQKGLATRALLEKMSEAELLEFLLLPGFTLKHKVTEISGRGVGLDAVQNAVKSVRGTLRIATAHGKGTCFQLQLPLTLSVLRALLVEVGGESYAIPLAQINRIAQIPRDQVKVLGGRQYYAADGRQIGLVAAHPLFGLTEPPDLHHPLPVIVLGARANRYGLVVSRFIGRRELVAQALDPRLGKIPNISGGAIMEDGSPVLIVDAAELVNSMEKFLAEGGLNHLPTAVEPPARRPRRILAVDDSPVVRDLERRLLTNHGYLTEVAADGIEAWNALRLRDYDLVITDLDMPHMNGFELAGRIKADPRLKSIPFMIVSYKDGEEDRARGFEAGADYYVTKGVLDDQTLVRAVVDLIGEPGT